VKQQPAFIPHKLQPIKSLGFLMRLFEEIQQFFRMENKTTAQRRTLFLSRFQNFKNVV